MLDVLILNTYMFIKYILTYVQYVLLRALLSILQYLGEIVFCDLYWDFLLQTAYSKSKQHNHDNISRKLHCRAWYQTHNIHSTRWPQSSAHSYHHVLMQK